jgi:RecB family endonuclease NucS
MPIYEIAANEIRKIEETTFSLAGLQERGDLQRLLRKQIEVIAPGTIVVAEEFGDWEDSKRRIDLLGVDKEANLVVIELKRTEDGGHMELQAIRYAAMVSEMNFAEVAEVFGTFLQRTNSNDDARTRLLEFLDWEEPDEERFAQDVRIVLVSADFSKELTGAVMWLNERGLDILCIKIQPYSDGGRVLVDVSC